MSDMNKPLDALEEDLEGVVEAIAEADRDLALRRAVAAYQNGAEHPLILMLVAEALEFDGRSYEALALLRRVTAEASQEPEAWRRLGTTLARLGMIADARMAFESALALSPDVYPTVLAAGEAAFRAGDLTEARRLFGRAAALAPNEAEPIAALAAIAARRDDAAEARAQAQRALTLRPGLVTAEMALGRADMSDGSPAASEARTARLLARTDLTPDMRVGVLDLRADCLDALDRPAEAFACYRQRNEILQLQNAPRVQHELSERRIDQARRLEAYFGGSDGASWILDAPPAELNSCPAGGLVFLMGFPRSGTTLLEKVLSSHPDVVALEEVDHLSAIGGQWLADSAGLERLLALDAEQAEAAREAYWSAVAGTVGGPLDGKVVVDKLPLHTLAMPVIAKLFPEARVLFALRDPRDVVLSCFRRRFQINSAMVEFLTLSGAADYYDQVMRLAEHYRRLLPLDVLEVRHEAVVADFETEIRRVLAFVGIDWDPSVTGFADRARQRSRTPSDPQVARGLNAEGVAQWRRYQRELAPVLAGLEPWVSRYGYPASPGPLVPAREWGFGFKVPPSTGGTNGPS
jgi:Flp pilus assembly protein TadD